MKIIGKSKYANVKHNIKEFIDGLSYLSPATFVEENGIFKTPHNGFLVGSAGLLIIFIKNTLIIDAINIPPKYIKPLISILNIEIITKKKTNKNGVINEKKLNKFDGDNVIPGVPPFCFTIIILI